MDFLKSKEGIKSMTMRYSIPSHSCVQKVDNAHTAVEKAVSATDFCLSLRLIRILLKVNRLRPYRVIEMHTDFKHFASLPKFYNYRQTLFTQVKIVTFTQTLHEIHFTQSYTETENTKQF